MLNLAFIFFIPNAEATVDEACAEVADTDGDGLAGPAPADYSEDNQNNFLLILTASICMG